jgi:uncharacterized protein
MTGDEMVDESAAMRLMVFLTEDDRTGHHSVAEGLLERARAAGLAGATIWRGSEGFGPSGHLRAERLPDLARGLPLVVEIIDEEASITNFIPIVREIAPGALVTTEVVRIARSSPPTA